jgi:hypothetical protein
MSALVTHREMARNLRYCEAELAKPDVTDVRRSTLEEKADFYRRHLANHCSHCGRPIEAEKSLETGLGSTCRQAVNV